MQPPEKIDKYQILSVLGKGAMGIVYHAYDPVVKRDVAIKFLSAIGAEETELISRFEREARLAGSLRHPNIVTIYDLGHFEGKPYIVMEYIVGKDLQTIIKKKHDLTFEQRVEIIFQICKGLDAAHQKGIIHRDIKPANIRIQEDNTVKIMDFGIARMGTSELTRSGYIIGTLQYMSPEQISGEQLDPRTDIFSTGVIGYELFTYSNPFNGEHTVDIMYRILNVHPQPVESPSEEYGNELNQIVMRSLEKNRELRYPSAKEMAQDLEEYLFYLKSLKFRRKGTMRLSTYQEGATQMLPVDSIPAEPTRLTDVPAAMSPSENEEMQTYLLPSTPAPAPPPGQTPPPQEGTSSKTKIVQPGTPPPAPPPSAARPTPTFGVPESTPLPTSPPRAGIGAAYSDTMGATEKPSFWQEKKFYILGITLALLFIGGIIFTTTMSGNRVELPVLTDPAGADVWMDGQKLGSTPMTLNDKSDATLTFRLKGYQDKEITLRKDRWPQEIRVSLEPDKVDTTPSQPPPTTERVIQVTTTPAGAMMLLDGAEAGQTPGSIKLPDEQSHQLIVKLDGFEPAEQTLDATSPDTLNLELQATVQPGMVKYAGKYPVAIILNGKTLKGNPVSLDPGTYKLSFYSNKPAYVRMTKTVEVQAGETVTVSEPAMGQLSVKAIPSNCKIHVDGEFLDVAPIFNRPIQAGTHTILFNWETLGKKQTRQVIVSGGKSDTITGVAE